ncbi:MAG: helix-turn-helix domain-containing protein [Lachnospiraceae bacterium]|nr:helix-turn-helix domain-containing protein [Lachnospiraceae bacterium]
MGRASTKENKNIYQRCREELGLTREKASERLPGLSPERIEKIENERSAPHPDEVLVMSEGYKAPQLCNYYCANECPIGRQYVPEVKIKDLSQIVLEMLASLNTLRRQQERLVEIARNGTVEDEEVEDFVGIQQELEKISITVETMQLWTEQMVAEGKIDGEIYRKYMGQKSE